MSNTLTGLVYRLVKGSPLTDQQGDNNLSLIQNFVNGLSNIIAASLNPDGSLKNGSINSINQFANLHTLCDAFALNESLPTGIFVTGNYTVTNSSIRVLTPGSRVAFQADTVNTGATTVTFTDGTTPIAAVPIVKGASLALIAGDILANQVVELIYDGTNFQLIQNANIFASAADIMAGTDATKVVTSAALKSASISFTSTPAVLLLVQGVISINHGLLATPSKVRWVLVAQSAGDLGYVSGDEVDVNAFDPIGGGNPGFSNGANASAVFLVFAYAASGMQVANKVTGVYAAITPAHWLAKCYASL